MTDNEGSLYKGDAAESVSELKVRDAEKVAIETLPVISEGVNVGLSEFQAANEAGVHVTKAENRRYDVVYTALSDGGTDISSQDRAQN